MYPLPTPLFWQRSSLCGKWKWQTNWNYWGLNIPLETLHKVPSKGKVKVTNAAVLIYLDHNCCHMSNWASVTAQNKSESEKTGKGGWFQYFFSDEDIFMIVTAAIFVAPIIALYTIFVAFASLWFGLAWAFEEATSVAVQTSRLSYPMWDIRVFWSSKKAIFSWYLIIFIIIIIFIVIIITTIIIKIITIIVIIIITIWISPPPHTLAS